MCPMGAEQVRSPSYLALMVLLVRLSGYVRGGGSLRQRPQSFEKEERRRQSEAGYLIVSVHAATIGRTRHSFGTSVCVDLVAQRRLGSTRILDARVEKPQNTL